MQAPAQKNSDDPTAALLQTGPEAAKPIGCEEGMNVDEMLTRFAGEFGPWQLRQFLLTSLAWILCAFQVMAVVFADRELAKPIPCPAGIRLGRAWWLARSTVEEWGLTCGEKYKVGLAQSAFFAGSMAGTKQIFIIFFFFLYYSVRSYFKKFKKKTVKAIRCRYILC